MTKQGRIVQITEEIALKAALVSLKYTLPMAYGLIYATGRTERALIWTQDIDLPDLPGVNYREEARTRG